MFFYITNRSIFILQEPVVGYATKRTFWPLMFTDKNAGTVPIAFVVYSACVVLFVEGSQMAITSLVLKLDPLFMERSHFALFPQFLLNESITVDVFCGAEATLQFMYAVDWLFSTIWYEPEDTSVSGVVFTTNPFCTMKKFSIKLHHHSNHLESPCARYWSCHKTYRSGHYV